MRSSRITTWLLLLATVGLSALGAACRPGDSQPGLLESSPPPHLALTSQQQRDLERQLEAEKQRIKEESERSKAVYDSLKQEWDRYLGDYQVTESGIVLCDPLSYTGEAKIVGPEGAELSIGPHKLRIPRGALKAHTVVTGEMPVSLSVGVRLSPHGLKFDTQPLLELSYKHCYLPTRHSERVAYVDGALNVLEYPTSRDQTGLILAWLKHFSKYVVAW